MFAIDLHIHTWYSKCSPMKPGCAVAAARRRGLHGVAITDHNSLRGWKSIGRKIWRDIRIIPGVEVATSKGDVLGYFVEEPIKSKIYEEVVDEILDLGGFPVLAHPFDGLRKSASHPQKPLAASHGIEIMNGRCLLPSANRKARTFAEQHGLSVTGGSDAHFHSEVGSCMTLFESDDPDDVLHALFHNHLYVRGSRSTFAVHPATFLVRNARRLLRKGPLWKKR
ncbi:MAG: PHP domain-containing protein [Candidatus Hodarchaeales archaeon]